MTYLTGCMAEPQPLDPDSVSELHWNTDGPEVISPRPTWKKDTLIGPLGVRTQVQTLLTLRSPDTLPN